MGVAVGRRPRRRAPSPLHASAATPLRRLPPGLARSSVDRVRAGGGIEHQLRKARTQPLALTGGGRLRLRVAVSRERRDLVDVGEDRLGEQSERAAVVAGLDRELRDAAPGDAGAEAIGRQQRVERAAFALLARAQSAIDGVEVGAVELGIGDEVGELRERDLDALANPGSETAAKRAVVGGHALTNRLDHLVAELGHVGAKERPELGGQLPPGLVDRMILCADDKNSTFERDFRSRNWSFRKPTVEA